MGVKAGLVGLPNVGKSTLFNALTQSNVPAENYPFCTIDPHLAITEVPDERLQKLLKIYGSKKIIPATVSFVDIAGLVQGASSGEGLGNQFLGHIQDVDLILHVVRCFANPTHDQPTPVADYETIQAELMLKDVESITKRLEKVAALIKRHQNNPKERAAYEQEQQLLKALVGALNQDDINNVRQLIKDAPVVTTPLLCAKDFLIIANIAEDEIEDNAYTKNPAYKALEQKFGQEKIIPIAAKTEHELTQLDEHEKSELMSLLGIKKRGLDEIIQKTYNLLGLITFFTCGPQEVHAWPIKKGMTVRQAAGEIHSDLQRGFICAEVFNCNDLFALGNETKLKELGKIRTEGQDYIVQDGDIIHVRFAI